MMAGDSLQNQLRDLNNRERELAQAYVDEMMRIAGDKPLRIPAREVIPTGTDKGVYVGGGNGGMYPFDPRTSPMWLVRDFLESSDRVLVELRGAKAQMEARAKGGTSIG